MSLQLSKDPNTAMQEMMGVIDSLRTIYRRETEALEAMNTKMFVELQAEKIKVACEYEEGVTQIAARKEEMRFLSPVIRARVEDMKKDFKTLSERNMDALKRMGRVTEHLGNTIRHAAKEAVVRERAFSYGETGALNAGIRKTVSTGFCETA